MGFQNWTGGLSTRNRCR